MAIGAPRDFGSCWCIALGGGGMACDRSSFGSFSRSSYKILFKFVQIVTGVELPCEATVGRNFVIDHFGGIIVSGYATFGDSCRIRNGVTIGLRRIEEKLAPAIGNNVDIGAGAKLLGPITIGDNVIIGANAVVLCDVPANSIAVGVPATIKPRACRATDDANGALRCIWRGGNRPK